MASSLLNDIISDKPISLNFAFVLISFNAVLRQALEIFFNFKQFIMECTIFFMFFKSVTPEFFEWLLIKDVPLREFKDIIITMKDGEVKCVSISRDTQEVPFNEGKIMLQKFSSYLNTNTILEHFEYYDQRQEQYEKNSIAMGNNSKN